MVRDSISGTVTVVATPSPESARRTRCARSGEVLVELGLAEGLDARRRTAGRDRLTACARRGRAPLATGGCEASPGHERIGASTPRLPRPRNHLGEPAGTAARCSRTLNRARQHLVHQGSMKSRPSMGSLDRVR